MVITLLPSLRDWALHHLHSTDGEQWNDSVENRWARATLMWTLQNSNFSSNPCCSLLRPISLSLSSISQASTHRGAVSVCGILALIANIFKMGKRDSLLPMGTCLSTYLFGCICIAPIGKHIYSKAYILYLFLSMPHICP